MGLVDFLYKKWGFTTIRICMILCRKTMPQHFQKYAQTVASIGLIGSCIKAV